MCALTVTPLSARMFAVWNLTSALVRAYAAFHIHEQGSYVLCAGTFVIALVHFVSELCIFRTTALGPGIISPLIVASASLVAMVLQFRNYVA